MRFLLASAFLIAFATAGTAADVVNFASDVAPILNKYCVGCHNADESEGGLRLDDHAGLIAGGDTGLAVTAGASRSSRMLLMATGKLEPRMPPAGEPGPTEQEIELITNWIDQGAIGTEGAVPIKMTIRTPPIAPAKLSKRPVTAIAITADASRRAVARFGSVEIQTGDGTPIAEIRDLPGKVHSLQFDRDGKRILVASGLSGAYGRAAIYHVEDAKLETELLGHRDIMYSAIFSPDEKWVATAGYDRVIKLWDPHTGIEVRELTGHNGAIYDLAFSPDSKVLVSACADATLKVWNVQSGERLDTLSQGEGEVMAVEVTADGKTIIACGADHRLRAWHLKSSDSPEVNPLVATRFVDESPLLGLALSSDTTRVAVLCQSGSVKLFDTSTWNQVAMLKPVRDTGTDILFNDATHSLLISLMNGRIENRELPRPNQLEGKLKAPLTPIYMDLGDLTVREESAGTSLPRGASVRGVISTPGEVDEYTWYAAEGEVWAIDADPTPTSPIDPIITILNVRGDPVLRTRLHAIRESYYTFRGKDSSQTNDFRLFHGQDMNLDDYLYSAGEVTRLWKHPRGPDSGFDTYPGEGKRWTYFGTSGTTHALGEPAYVVRPLADDETPVSNGLPVFDIYYQNDDDPMRIAGHSSRLRFTAPSAGLFKVRVTDTRGEGGANYDYDLKVRAAAPGFRASLTALKGPIFKGTGREFTVSVDRMDGFEGPVKFTLNGLPQSVTSNSPIIIEAGQRSAVGTLWVPARIDAEEAKLWNGEINATVVASANVLGRHVERVAGQLKQLKLAEDPAVIPSLHPLKHDVPENEAWLLQVRRGETVSARVRVRRQAGFTNEVSFGKEDSGRNASHGVYIDNIGLNGLLVLADDEEREFFLTADAIAEPGRRSFFLTTNTNGGVTTHPIVVEVLP